MALQSFASAIAYLKGKKTYFMSALSVAFGIMGGYTGWLDKPTAVEFIVAGLGLASLRNGINPPPTATAEVAPVIGKSSDTIQAAT
jgi:hypothetical protein